MNMTIEHRPPSTLQDRLAEGHKWALKTMRAIPASVFFQTAELSEDLVRATDQMGLFDRLSIRTRKRYTVTDANYKDWKWEFTMRLSAKNGHETEFEKIMHQNWCDALIYAYHDKEQVVSWIVINLRRLRKLWRDHAKFGLESKLYEDKDNDDDGSPFRLFNVKKINDPHLMVACSWEDPYSQSQI